MATWRVSLVVALLVSSTVAFHKVSHGEPIPARRVLGSFPKTVGAWEGDDVKLDLRMVKALKADDLLTRVYRAPQYPPLWLYIAYFKSQRQGETIHSPKNCLPGSGWEPLESGREAVSLGAGRSVVVNRYLVQNGLDRQLVLYWYESHGRTIASEYRAKVYMVLDAIKMNRTDGALVRVSLPLLGDELETDKIAQQFVREIYAHLGEYIPE